MQDTIKNRTIFCKDNLIIMRGINSNSIDLIYLDPPFNTNKVFTAPIGSSAEGASFKDIFQKEDVKEVWLLDLKEDKKRLYDFLIAVKNLGNDYNFCYLCYMAIRLMEMQRILKNTGSLYLHCDPTMSHYLKLLLDIIFKEENFRNEIIWCYSGGGRSKRDFANKHDIILRYSKSNDYIFNADAVRIDYNLDASKYKSEKSWGSHKGTNKSYKPNKLGKIPEDHWKISPINSQSKERTGYPTQKPLVLMYRIIEASSNKGNVVFDPFCGCATTCVASEKLGRQWVGIDVSIEAYKQVKKRLAKEITPEYTRPRKRSQFYDRKTQKKR